MSILHRFVLFALLFVCTQKIQAQYLIPDEITIDYSAEDLPLREVLYQLGDISRVTIAFQEEIIPGDSLISLAVRNEKLGKIIDYIINPHGLKYKIVGNQIVIKKDPYTSSRDKITISGYLKDEESGEPLVNANIYLYDKSAGTTTNEYGFYSFTIDKGIKRVYFSYLGYDLGIQEFDLAKDTVVDIKMLPSNRLNEVVIKAKRYDPVIEFPEVASVDILPIDRISAGLPLGGEADIIRYTYTLPGVTSGADGFGGMSVRGGATNQNLILFDGIPVYNANHAFGLFSIFNSNVIKSAKLYKGAFPSHYSGRLSSVLDIRTREGNNQKMAGDVSVGILAVKASLEGPIVKDKASYLISFRRTFVDPWIKSLTEYLNEREGKTGNSDIYFLDFNGKLNFSLGPRSKIYLSYYTGSDNFNNITSEVNDEKDLENLDETFWESRNNLASLRWNLQLSQKSFLNISAYYSKYNFGSFDHDRVNILESGQQIDNFYEAGYYQSSIEDRGVKLDMDIIPGSSHKIKIGGGIVKHQFNPGLLLVDNFDQLTEGEELITQNQLKSLLDEETIEGDEYEFYIEDNIRLGEYSHLNIGYNHLMVKTGKTYHIVQPRLLFNTGSKKYTFKFSAGRMGQYLHNLTNSGLGIPVDVWLPSTDIIEPEVSWIFSAGNFFKSQKFGMIGFETFYKDFSNLTRYGDSGLVDISTTSNWESLIPIGDGTAYGFEFSHDQRIGNTAIKTSYTLSWSDRTFPGINNGETFRYRYDRRHVFDIGILHKLGENIEFSANWQYASGSPITVADGQNYF
ncbi:MAG: TonB-dependent receptor, partial [Bacteroidia bacterium]|nr:TonB-dependent receptor [Bacteroidia bacterium]